jgi:hypothetical protein
MVLDPRALPLLFSTANKWPQGAITAPAIKSASEVFHTGLMFISFDFFVVFFSFVV